MPDTALLCSKLLGNVGTWVVMKASLTGELLGRLPQFYCIACKWENLALRIWPTLHLADQGNSRAGDWPIADNGHRKERLGRGKCGAFTTQSQVDRLYLMDIDSTRASEVAACTKVP